MRPTLPSGTDDSSSRKAEALVSPLHFALCYPLEAGHTEVFASRTSAEMSNLSQASHVLSAVATTRRRLRIQRALEAAATLGALCVVAATCAVYLHKAHVVVASWLLGLLGIAAVVPLVGAAVYALGPMRNAHVAKRIDDSHGLHDRLGTALEFAGLERPSRFHLAQVRDAERHAQSVTPALAAPLSAPGDLRLLGLTALCLAAVLLVRFPVTPAPRQHVEPLARLSIDPQDLEPHRALANALLGDALEQDLPELERMARELNKLFEQILKKELTRKELFSKLAELEKKYMDGFDGNFDDLLKKLKKMGGELQKEKLTREAGKALDRADLTRARQELAKLAEKTDRLNQSRLSRRYSIGKGGISFFYLRRPVNRKWKILWQLISPCVFREITAIFLSR